MLVQRTGLGAAAESRLRPPVCHNQHPHHMLDTLILTPTLHRYMNEVIKVKMNYHPAKFPFFFSLTSITQ